jgi:hypothetical protein
VTTHLFSCVLNLLLIRLQESQRRGHVTGRQRSWSVLARRKARVSLAPLLLRLRRRNTPLLRPTR